MKYIFITLTLLLLISCEFKTSFDIYKDKEVTAEFKGKHLIFSPEDINKYPDPVETTSSLSDIQWLRDNDKASAKQIMKVLGLKKAYKEEDKLYFVNNDTVLVTTFTTETSKFQKILNHTIKKPREALLHFPVLKIPTYGH